MTGARGAGALLLGACLLAACAGAGRPAQAGQRLIVHWEAPVPALAERLRQAGALLGVEVEHVRELGGGGDLLRLRQDLGSAALNAALARLGAGAGIDYAVLEQRRGAP